MTACPKHNFNASLSSSLTFPNPFLGIFWTTGEIMCFLRSVGDISAPARRLSACHENPTADVLSVWTGLLHYDQHNYHHHYLSPPYKKSHSPALTSEAAPASPADQSPTNPMEMNRFPDRTEAISLPPPRSDQASSATGEKRPRLPCVYVSVGVCASLQAAAVGCRGWLASETREPIPPDYNKKHFRLLLQNKSFSEKTLCFFCFLDQLLKMNEK